MTEDRQILQLLSDGGFHSGQALAATLVISRSALWKRLQKLQQQLGIQLYAVSGKGYKLATPLQLLDPDRLKQQLLQYGSLRVVPVVETHLSLASTNQYALEQARQAPYLHRLVLAERQTEGRGRRGRHWVSPFGRNLYLSLYWWFDNMPESVSCLSLMVAITLAQQLESIGVPACELKWPNDVRYRGRKLAGILLEMQGEAAGGCGIVIGVGVNLDLDEPEAQAIDQPWTDVKRILGKTVERNQFAAEFSQRLIGVMQGFSQGTFTQCLEDWRSRDVLDGRQVDLRLDGEVMQGIARGVDDSGALLLESDGRIRRYYSGEVSVRLAEEDR